MRLHPLRRATFLSTLVTALLLGLATTAWAQDSAARPVKELPLESPKWATGSFNLGGLFLADPNIQAAYGSKGRFVTQLQFGLVPWSKYVHIEVDFGFGFSQFKGSQSFVDGSGSSADDIMMTLFPLTADLLVGLDLVHEQPVMPYGGVGFNVTPWREIELEGSSEWNGARFGGSVFFGGAFLLDILERKRAARLDATTGINDAYITVEGRYRRVDAAVVNGALDTSGLNFGGWSITGGLKLVF